MQINGKRQRVEVINKSEMIKLEVEIEAEMEDRLYWVNERMTMSESFASYVLCAVLCVSRKCSFRRGN